MMLDVKRINAAVDLEVKRLAAEVANVGDTRFSKWGYRASGEHVVLLKDVTYKMGKVI